MQEPAKRFINIMKQLPSGHQIGDYVVAIFPPHALLNCKVEAVRFKANGAVFYDLSVQVKRPEWDKPQFAKLSDVHWSFVVRQGNENDPRSFDLAYENEKCLPPSIKEERKMTVSELQSILYKMDYYKLTSGFIVTHTTGAQPDFYETLPDLINIHFDAVTREEVLRMIEEA